ncbi:hypothetical protein M9H77_03687 [Catharanthus roseus]|uniref:Uncharacterized protein n=1 Tax=Catharanthus roseus TaxID=4058 RepID=A0ACC0CBY6_CATRO|nr:hypothetical protein M9H77_03687 [Catharanthus roseus]
MKVHHVSGISAGLTSERSRQIRYIITRAYPAATQNQDNGIQGKIDIITGYKNQSLTFSLAIFQRTAGTLKALTNINLNEHTKKNRTVEIPTAQTEVTAQYHQNKGSQPQNLQAKPTFNRE